MKLNYLKLAISIIICQAAGFIGSIFTSPVVKSDWYINLNKPSFQPPNWLFGPVWGALFLLMGISLYLIWITQSDKLKKTIPLVVFGIHLFLNIAWSFLFFYKTNPFLAFIEILVLWLTILITMILFIRMNKTAGILFIPYLLWVTFASVLNFHLWILNP